jgi:hypothetical protein
VCDECIPIIMSPGRGGDACCIICRTPIESYELGSFNETYVNFPGVDGGPDGPDLNSISGPAAASCIAERACYESKSTNLGPEFRAGTRASSEAGSSECNSWSMSTQNSTKCAEAGSWSGAECSASSCLSAMPPAAHLFSPSSAYSSWISQGRDLTASTHSQQV